METKDIAEKLVNLCKEGRDSEALEFYSDNAESIEAQSSPGMPQDFKGKAAIREKQRWWYEKFEIKEAKIVGPYVHGERFAVHFEMEILDKQSKESNKMSEVALYTCENGKIVKEEFFY